jgi:hypothetical protein
MIKKIKNRPNIGNRLPSTNSAATEAPSIGQTRNCGSGWPPEISNSMKKPSQTAEEVDGAFLVDDEADEDCDCGGDDLHHGSPIVVVAAAGELRGVGMQGLHQAGLPPSAPTPAQTEQTTEKTRTNRRGGSVGRSRTRRRPVRRRRCKGGRFRDHRLGGGRPVIPVEDEPAQEDDCRGYVHELHRSPVVVVALACGIELMGEGVLFSN